MRHECLLYGRQGEGGGQLEQREGQSVNLERFVNVTVAERRPRIEPRTGPAEAPHSTPLPPSAHPRISLLCLKCLPRLMNNARNFSSAFGFLLSFRFAFFSFFFLVLHSATISLSAWQALSSDRGGGRYEEEEGCREGVRRQTSFLARSALARSDTLRQGGGSQKEEGLMAR